MATYRGILVDDVNYDPKAKTFALYSSSGDLIAEMKREEYLSQPSIRTLGHTNGRHRKSYTPFHRSAAFQSGNTVDWRAINFSVAGLASGGWVTFDVSEPKPVTHSGIRAGEIIAPRAWRVDGDRLFSVYMNDEWLPGKPIQGDPRDKASHGVHAFKDRSSIVQYLWHKSAAALFDGHIEAMLGIPSENRKPKGFVIGTVAMWGEIVEHERGWRGEFGRIASIDSAHNADITSQAALDALRLRYGVSASENRSAA